MTAVLATLINKSHTIHIKNAMQCNEHVQKRKQSNAHWRLSRSDYRQEWYLLIIVWHIHSTEQSNKKQQQQHTMWTEQKIVKTSIEITHESGVDAMHLHIGALCILHASHKTQPAHFNSAIKVRHSRDYVSLHLFLCHRSRHNYSHDTRNSVCVFQHRKTKTKTYTSTHTITTVNNQHSTSICCA